MAKNKKKKITLSEYQDFVMGLMSPDSMATFQSRLATAGLGLAGEGGECADLVKKVLFHGLEFDESVRKKLSKELGDILFYVTFAAVAICEVDIKDILEENKEKLLARYTEGKFSREEFLKKEMAKDG